jgi:hypothetical protein
MKPKIFRGPAIFIMLLIPLMPFVTGSIINFIKGRSIGLTALSIVNIFLIIVGTILFIYLFQYRVELSNTGIREYYLIFFRFFQREIRFDQIEHIAYFNYNTTMMFTLKGYKKHLLRLGRIARPDTFIDELRKYLSPELVPTNIKTIKALPFEVLIFLGIYGLFSLTRLTPLLSLSVWNLEWIEEPLRGFVDEIAPDSSGGIWMANHYFENYRIAHFSATANPEIWNITRGDLDGGYVYEIGYDKNNQPWILSDDVYYRYENEWKKLAMEEFSREVTDGRVIWGIPKSSQGTKIIRIDPSSLQITSIDMPKVVQGWNSTLKAFQDGTILMISTKDDLGRISLLNDEQWTEPAPTLAGLSETKLLDATLDPIGRIWVLILQGGYDYVGRLDNQTQNWIWQEVDPACKCGVSYDNLFVDPWTSMG